MCALAGSSISKNTVASFTPSSNNQPSGAPVVVSSHGVQDVSGSPPQVAGVFAQKPVSVQPQGLPAIAPPARHGVNGGKGPRAVQVRQRDENGMTPLDHAAHRGDVKMVKTLIEANAEVNAGADPAFKSPLYYAVKGQQVDVVQELLGKGARADEIYADGQGHIESALDVANRGKDKAKSAELATLLIKKGQYGTAPRDQNLLPWAMKNGYAEAVGVLKGRRHVDKKGQRNLVMFSKNPECIKSLVDGESQERKDYLLIAAAHIGNISAVKAMIEAGADVNGVNKSGCSALHYAVYYGQAEVVRLLLEKNANPALPSALGTPFDMGMCLYSGEWQVQRVVSPTHRENVARELVLGISAERLLGVLGGQDFPKGALRCALETGETDISRALAPYAGFRIPSSGNLRKRFNDARLRYDARKSIERERACSAALRKATPELPCDIQNLIGAFVGERLQVNVEPV